MYAKYYGLRALPFQLTPDSRFFYPSQMHRGALAYLTYGLRKSEGFVLITGDVGTGKTLLVDYLLSIIDPERYLTAKILTTQVEPDEVLAEDALLPFHFGLHGPGHDGPGFRRGGPGFGLPFFPNFGSPESAVPDVSITEFNG